jgi:hypothetical protein
MIKLVETEVYDMYDRRKKTRCFIRQVLQISINYIYMMHWILLFFLSLALGYAADVVVGIDRR